eukprot:TRINITY_DN8008_c0_g1_i1.p1 TRINITY_DN8008_c0_g1~~TRINITY_DN8008_c0_g1_i1.p1  ORF type:complete len:387 (-),score=82.39 TRINITY_DN8008_c0_g1_i1:169-1329(-)
MFKEIIESFVDSINNSDQVYYSPIISIICFLIGTFSVHKLKIKEKKLKLLLNAELMTEDNYEDVLKKINDKHDKYVEEYSKGNLEEGYEEDDIENSFGEESDDNEGIFVHIRGNIGCPDDQIINFSNWDKYHILDIYDDIYENLIKEKAVFNDEEFSNNKVIGTKFVILSKANTSVSRDSLSKDREEDDMLDSKSMSKKYPSVNLSKSFRFKVSPNIYIIPSFNKDLKFYLYHNLYDDYKPHDISQVELPLTSIVYQTEKDKNSFANVLFSRGFTARKFLSYGKNVSVFGYLSLKQPSKKQQRRYNIPSFRYCLNGIENIYWLFPNKNNNKYSKIYNQENKLHFHTYNHSSDIIKQEISNIQTHIKYVIGTFIGFSFVSILVDIIL